VDPHRRGLANPGVGLILKPDWFSFVDSAVLRAVIYILKRIATLGTSNDLGIVAGHLEIIIDAVMLIFFIYKNGCGKAGGKKQNRNSQF
jgi:hypothetical protein